MQQHDRVTHADIARVSQVNRTTVSMVMAGKRMNSPHAEKILSIANQLACGSIQLPAREKKIRPLGHDQRLSEVCALAGISMESGSKALHRKVPRSRPSSIRFFAAMRKLGYELDHNDILDRPSRGEALSMSDSFISSSFQPPAEAKICPRRTSRLNSLDDYDAGIKEKKKRVFFP